jgi:localization factor PodJL
MRRNVVTGPERFDTEAQDIILQAAERAGMSVEAWIEAALGERAARPAARPSLPVERPRPAPAPGYGNEVEALLAALRLDRPDRRPAEPARSFAPQGSAAHGQDYGDHAPRNEAQARLGNAFAQALATIKDRLDDIERRAPDESASSRAAPASALPRPTSATNAKVVPLPRAPEPAPDAAFVSLKADIAGLAAQIAARREEDPALAALRHEIHELQTSLEGLATRGEVAAIEHVIRDLATNVTQARAKDEVKAVSAALAELQQQVRRLSTDISEGVHRRVGSAIELLNWKVDIAAANGVDAGAIQQLEAQLTEMRRSLAELAEPQRIERISQEVAQLGNQLTELRRHLQRDDVSSLRADVSSYRGEMVALREALDALRASVLEAETSRPGSPLPEEWDHLSRRLDALLSRPAAASLEPVNDRLAAIAEHLADLRAEQSPAAVASTLESRFDRLDHRLVEVARGLDTASLEAVLRSLAHKVDEVQAAQAQIGSVEQQVEAVAAKLDQGGSPSLQAAMDEIRDALRASSGSSADAAVLQQLEHISEQIGLLASRPQTDLTPLRERLDEQLAAIAERLEQPAAPQAVGLSESDVEQLAARLDALIGGRSHENLTASQEQLADRFDRIEDALRQVGQSADTASVEILLRTLGSKVDEVHASQGQLGTIERQLEALQTRLDENLRPGPGVEALHQSIGDAVGHMLSLREEAALIAERAARAAVLETHASSPANDALRQGLDELRALHVSMDERTNHTLLAIQAAMDNLAERLPALAAEATSVARLEAAVRKLRSAAEAPNTSVTPAPPVNAEPSRNPMPAGSDADRSNAPGSTRPAQAVAVPTEPSRTPERAPAERAPAVSQAVTLTPPAGTDPASLRTSLIAAARRTMKGAAAETPPPDQSPDAHGDAAPEGFGERLRRSIQARRRALLLAAAASVLVFGVVQIAGTFQDGKTAMAAKPVLPGGAETKAAEASKSPDGLKAAEAAKPLTSLDGMKAGIVRTAAKTDGAPTVTGQPDGMGSSATKEAPKKADEASDKNGAARPPVTSTGTLPGSVAPAPTPAPQVAAAALPPAQQVAAVAPAATSPAAAVPAPAAAAPAAAKADELPPGIPAGLRQAVLAGNANAIYELAFYVAEGRDTPKDPALAAKLFERAANAGLAPAQFHLGHMYEKGIGVPKDLTQAHDWYRRAAERGNARAMHNLAVLLAGGVNGKPNYPAALPWFRQAADLGVRDSQFNLALVLAWGIGTPRNLIEAYKWFAIVGSHGDQEATTKRDEIASQLAPADLATAKTMVEAWRVRASDQSANTVQSPPQGWSGSPEGGNGRG